jgi:Ca2+-binding RTX toxin-like protein
MTPRHQLARGMARSSLIVLLGLITASTSAIVASAAGSRYVDPEIVASPEGSLTSADGRIPDGQTDVPQTDGSVADADGGTHDYGEVVDYPLVFPVGGNDFYYADDQYLGFWACRDGCARTHHAIDILADKMTEVYAVADGTVAWIGPTCCSVFLTHDDGWETWYIHLNNDTEGTDDGLGWGIAPGIEIGTHVERGQLIGWVGDSGNAEDTVPHLHFELYDPADIVVNPYRSLREADEARGLTCGGRPATRTDTNGDHVVLGTPYDDVIVGTNDADYLNGLGGNDLICGGGGDDTLLGGTGDDAIWGGDGDDYILAGRGADLLYGNNGRDYLYGAAGNDSIWGGRANDRISGASGDDYLVGDKGHDSIYGGDGNDVLLGMPGRDSLYPQTGNDVVVGGSGRDTIYSTSGQNLIHGGIGRDTVTYSEAPGPVIVDLLAGTATGAVDDILRAIECVCGSPYDDVISGDDRSNTLLGLEGDDLLLGGKGGDSLYGDAGNDSLKGGPGHDSIYGGDGDDDASGGTGTDYCSTEYARLCES